MLRPCTNTKGTNLPSGRAGSQGFIKILIKLTVFILHIDSVLATILTQNLQKGKFSAKINFILHFCPALHSQQEGCSFVQGY